MKIICSVEVFNRALPSLNIASSKAVRSSLTIAKSENEVFIVHQTNHNINGKKYKVKNNVTNVFVKFVNEGKATIRFKEPEHDLAIKCDAIQLKGFLRTLKFGLDGIPSHQMSTFCTNTFQNKPLKSIKTKLKVKSREDYPVLEGFPRTLESLIINNASQKYLDSRILRLRNLRVLSMGNNNLTILPEQLGASLPNLAELYLDNNSLGLSRDWRWIVSSKLQKQLKLLDLRANNIIALPDKIVKLVSLVTLKLDNNNLHELPLAIGCMTNLRYFSASNNCINYLPGSIFLLKLESIDLSGNTFLKSLHNRMQFRDFQVFPSLVDIAASCVITKKLYYSEEILPQTLVEHLECASFCVCGKPCFLTQPQSYIQYQPNHSRPATVVSSYDCIYTVAVRYCSFHCYTRSETPT